MEEQNNKPDPKQEYAMLLKSLDQRNQWEERGQPWRTEPEIDSKRQKHLEECRTVTTMNDPYHVPFKDVRLNRADIEWLLATHEGGIGPIDWDDPRQRTRAGLDLRGADVRGINLDNLPMAKVELASAHLVRVQTSSCVMS